MSQHQFCISIEYGESFLSLVAHGNVEQHAFDVVSKAVGLAYPNRNVRARSTFTLTRDTDWTNVRSGLASFTLSTRVLLPNAKSLVENPGLSRRNELLDLFPGKSVYPAEPWTPRDFYDHVHIPPRGASTAIEPIEQLKCNLLPFQRRAIQWMLEREGALPFRGMGTADMPHGFVHVEDEDNRPCYMSRLLGLATTNADLLHSSSQDMKGVGLLAEEMGLGKTVEIIGLICLHKRRSSGTLESAKNSETPATLVITPPSLLQQWKDELQNLAPSLTVVTYEGMKTESHTSDDMELRAKIKAHDVVLTTYHVLAKDIYHAEGPTKSLRHRKRYEKRLSPLIQLDFWRVVLDEAQLVESGVSNAARVASLIPRKNAWCVSGTPARNAKDLLGLLIFLRVEPYCSRPALWDRLVRDHRNVLRSIFQAISLRHTKSQIRDELVLPSQKRIVITVPFTQVEEQHYTSLFQQMAEDCGLSQEGTPLREDWNPDDSLLTERMHLWLARLRQTCLHPEVGSRNRKALGSGKGPLRTVAEVLEVMIDQNEATTRSEERNLLLSQIRRGQILEHAELTQEALDIWLLTLDRARVDVQACRKQLELELDNLASETHSQYAYIDDEVAESARTRVYRQRLRGALEIEHTCTFFVANAYYQLKIKESRASSDDTGPNGAARCSGAHTDDERNSLNANGDSSNQSLRYLEVPNSADHSLHATNSQHENQTPMTERANEFQRHEEMFYDRAKLLRKELMAEPRKKAILCVEKVKRAYQQLVSRFLTFSIRFCNALRHLA